MAESVKERVGEAVQQAKSAVKKNEPTAATDAEGRVAVVREALQAFGSGDFEGFLGALDDKVEWEGPKGESFPGGSTLTGRGEIEEKFIGDVRRSYVTFGFVPGTWLEAEDRDWVVIVGAFQGEGLNGRGEFEEPAVQVWEFHNGTVATIRIFADSAAFPAIVTEEDKEEMDRKEAENEKDDSGDAEDTQDAGETRDTGEGDDADGPQASGEERSQEEQAAEDPGKGSGDEEHDAPGARS